MALSNISLSFSQRNDGTALILTDSTGTNDSTDWGVGGNVNYTDIDGTNYDLLLDITITTSDGTATIYDQIDLYDEFGPFLNYEDLIFTIIPTMLKESGSTSFDSGDKMPDGIYDIIYTVTNAGSGGDDVTFEEDLLVDGVVRAEVYDMIRNIPHIYEKQGDVDSIEVREAIFAYSYLAGIKASAYTSDKEEILTQLGVLENIIRNGSNNTW